jgi:heme oxygenase (biliverdin-IX-beta and delta-forming)
MATAPITGTTVLLELRRATAVQHRALEADAGIWELLASKASYEKLLARSFGIYSVLETQIEAVSNLAAVLTDLGARRKVSALRADLAVLGVAAADCEICADVPKVATIAAALGCLYVLEGSTLGGQMMAREVGKRLDLGPQDGCEFFSSYGPRVGDMWKSFTRDLEEYSSANPDCREETIATA